MVATGLCTYGGVARVWPSYTEKPPENSHEPLSVYLFFVFLLMQVLALRSPEAPSQDGIPEYLLKSGQNESWCHQEFRLAPAVVEERVGPMRALFGDGEGHIPRELNPRTFQLDFAAHPKIHHMLPANLEVAAAVGVLVEFLRFRARNPLARILLRVKAALRAMPPLVRFHKFIKETREARIRDMVRKWEATETSKRDEYQRVAQRQHMETMRVSQDYAVGHVPEGLKYDAVTALYWQRTREFQKEFRRWSAQCDCSRDQYKRLTGAMQRKAWLCDVMQVQPQIQPLAEEHLARGAQPGCYEDPGPRPRFRFSWDTVTAGELATAASTPQSPLPRRRRYSEQPQTPQSQGVGRIRGSFCFPMREPDPQGPGVLLLVPHRPTPQQCRKSSVLPGPVPGVSPCVTGRRPSQRRLELLRRSSELMFHRRSPSAGPFQRSGSVPERVVGVRCAMAPPARPTTPLPLLEPPAPRTQPSGPLQRPAALHPKLRGLSDNDGRPEPGRASPRRCTLPLLVPLESASARRLFAKWGGKGRADTPRWSRPRPKPEPLPVALALPAVSSPRL